MSSSALAVATPEMIARYEPVIGLEVHVQLATATKIFCGCPTSFGAPPNTNVCPVCLGLPGALPVLSREAVELAIKAALALNCTHPPALALRPQELFLSRPAQGLPDLAIRRAVGRARLRRHRGGRRAKRIGVTRVHMEDDAGKSIHDGFTRFRPLLLRGPEPLRHAADRNRQRARHAQLRRSLRLPHRGEAGAAVHRGLHLRHGEGPPALRRQRLACGSRARRSSAPRPR